MISLKSYLVWSKQIWVITEEMITRRPLESQRRHFINLDKFRRYFISFNVIKRYFVSLDIILRDILFIVWIYLGIVYSYKSLGTTNLVKLSVM